MDKDIVNVDKKELISVVNAAVGSGGSIRITVVGNSMYPFLRSGIDSAELSDAGDVRPKDVLFYVRGDGNCILHRCIRIENGEYIMCGDNQTELERGIRRNQIIASAKTFYRRDKKITDKTFWYRVYKFFWCTLFPLRPALCVILKAFRKIKRKRRRRN